MLDEIDGPPTRKASPRPPQPESSKTRQSMTERESKVLTDMLDMVFTPKDQHTSPSSSIAEPSASAQIHDEVGPAHVNDLFGRLRRIASRRPTQKARIATAELFDMKKEQMNNCTTDQMLLEWAAREVFEESMRYEKAARDAVAQAAQSSDKKRTLLPLQSPIYPNMIAYLMQTFRVTYRDPNLALYIFNYTQKLSIVSYTFGCSTDTYNELIETHWSSFRDLQGILNAIQEMEVNAVPINNRTQQLIEGVRRDLGKGIVSQNNTSQLLLDVENAVARVSSGRQTRYASLGAWKKSLENEGEDGFDDWSNLELLKGAEKAPRSKRR